MNYGEIKKCDIANGIGVRVSLFVSGCSHHCKGCFNEMTWDFNYGRPFTKETEDILLEYLEPDYIEGLSLLGGEPFEHSNQEALLPFLERVKEKYPGKTIWCYSGYIFEKDMLEYMCKEWDETSKILKLIDVLVDGPFIEAKKNLSLLFRGSENQRIIDVKKSLAEGKTILWNDVK